MRWWTPSLAPAFHGGLPEDVQTLAEAVNAWNIPLLAVDAPSGLNSHTGAVENSAFRSSWTVVLGHLKTGLLSPHQDLIDEPGAPWHPEAAYQVLGRPLTALGSQ